MNKKKHLIQNWSKTRRIFLNVLVMKSISIKLGKHLQNRKSVWSPLHVLQISEDSQPPASLLGRGCQLGVGLPGEWSHGCKATGHQRRHSWKNSKFRWKIIFIFHMFQWQTFIRNGLKTKLSTYLVSRQLPWWEVGHVGHAHVLHGRGELEGVGVLGVWPRHAPAPVLAGLHVHLGQQGATGVLLMLRGGGRV